jgi:hypothetical protein
VDSAQSIANGQWLGKLILHGKCPERHENSGRCIGTLKLFRYPWCGQHRLACDHCGTVIRVNGFNMDPMPLRMALDIAEYVETVECDRESGLWAIRKRFREIEYRTAKAQQVLFG